MDPVTIVFLIILSVIGTGAGRQTYKRVQHRRREELREALLEKYPAPDRYVSIFDLFWDLGVSDFALTIMGHQGLLPAKPDERGAVFNRIGERIDEHGSYAAFIDDVLEAIQEFYQDHRAAGDRRLLPTLDVPSSRLLPLPEGQRPGLMPSAAPEHDGLPDGYLLDIDLEERARIRESRAATDSALVPVGARRSVDLDDLLRAGPIDILKGLLDGNFSKRLDKWIQMRQLRVLREDLDDKLGRLYLYFESMIRNDPDALNPLYDLTRRWEREAIRIEQLERERPWAERPWATACDLLVQEARILSRYLGRHAKKNTDDAIQSIRANAQKGNRAMAGYLVYANRFAFFAGRGDAHAELVSEIEYAAAKIQTELRELRAKQVL